MRSIDKDRDILYFAKRETYFRQKRDDYNEILQLDIILLCRHEAVTWRFLKRQMDGESYLFIKNITYSK